MQLNLPLDIQQSTPKTPNRRRLRTSAETEITSRKKRVNKRNIVMIARYYYWTEIRRRRFDDVMKILSDEEFFVEDRTISNALLDFSEYLDKLFSEKKTARSLKKDFPAWCWDLN